MSRQQNVSSAIFLQHPLVFTDKFLCRQLFTYLSLNDLTSLGMTCHTWYAMVRSSRSQSYPYIVWEERFPTKIGYKDVEDRYDDLLEVRASTGLRIVSVSQLQRFRFIVQTDPQESVQTEITLINTVWHEQDNMRDGHQCRKLTDFPSRTAPSITITRPGVSNHATRRLPAFKIEHDEELEEMGYYGEVDGNPREYKHAMNIVWTCAKRVADSPDGIAYPSAAYLMQTIARRYDLTRYYPTSCVQARRARDRKTVVQFSYRPARSAAEWAEILPQPPTNALREFEMHQVPWYRKGYTWFSDGDDDYDSASEA